MSDLTNSQKRLLDFVKKSLDERMKPFVDQEATPELRDRIEAVVVGHLTRIAQDLQTEVPKVEAFMPEPGVVSFRFVGPLDPKMHRALWEAGLVNEPPESIVLTMTVPVEPPAWKGKAPLAEPVVHAPHIPDLPEEKK